MTPTSTQRKLCRSLGPDYEIKLFDLEYVACLLYLEADKAGRH